jgi:hypothetical protein
LMSIHAWTAVFKAPINPEKRCESKHISTVHGVVFRLLVRAPLAHP